MSSALRCEFRRVGKAGLKLPEIFLRPLAHGGRRTLFMLRRGLACSENVDDAIAARTGQVLIADAPAPDLSDRERPGRDRSAAHNSYIRRPSR